MKLHILFLCVFCSLHVISAYDIFEGFFKQGGPCFDAIEVPKCHATLAEGFEPKAGVNKATTLAYLFTPKSPNTAEPLHLCGGRLPPHSTYDPEANTEIFVHGWLDGMCRSAWMREMKEQLFLRGSYNVILIDWTWGNTPDYFTAGKNSMVVGKQVGFIINNIIHQTGCHPKKFHVIGHSFGAIAAGFTGRSVKGLRRITALDPAYAPFGNYPPNHRVTYRDAEIVDVIHSNGYTCFALGIGDSRPLGHADFYPNGGKFQSSCYPYLLKSLLKLDILYGIVNLDPRLCSHTQAIQFYKLSINSNGCEFVGVPSRSYESFLQQQSRSCSSEWAVMGMDYELYHSRRNKRRKKYFLKTLDNCPYYDDSYLGTKKFPFNVSCTN